MKKQKLNYSDWMKKQQPNCSDAGSSLESTRDMKDRLEREMAARLADLKYVSDARDELRAQLGRLTAMFRQCVADETPHSLVRLTLEVARAEELVKSR